MKRLFAFLASLLLLVGCEELLPKEKPVITLDPDQSTSVTVDAEGGSFDVHFTSALPWSVEIVYSGGSDGWVGISKGSGEGGYTIEKVQVIVQKNESDVKRSAKLVIKSDTVTEEVSFTQSAATTDPGNGQDPEPAVFKLTEGSAEVGADGGKVQVTVQYNVDYEITILVDWIREVETRSYDEKVHTFEIDANTETESRTATISFCGNETCHPFVITQAAAETDVYLDVDNVSISVAAEGTAAPVTVNVTSNLPWNVASDAAWCEVSPSSGENDGSFDITVSENVSYDSRIANITVSAVDGSLSRTIAVIQSPAQREEGDDSWVEAEFVHRSLAFRFTADWCGFCPMMATAMNDAQKELPGKLEVISVHGGGSGLACSASKTLANNYPIDGFPTGLVDGRTYIANYAIPVTTSLIVEAVNETESKYETVTAASWTSKVSGSQVTLDLSAYIKKAGSYKITALLVEDKVISYQADYNNGASDAYEHNGIIRAALSNVLGENVEVTEDAQVKTFTYSAELPSECNKDNVRVVVYIQRKDSDNSYYVDNTASAAVGKDKNLDMSSGSWSDGNEGIVPGDDISIK